MVVGGKGKGKAAKVARQGKGGQKQFTDFRELQKQQDDVDNHWKKPQPSNNDDSSEDEPTNQNKGLGNDIDTDDELPIIETNNPNAAKKNIKLADISAGAGEKVELSRRERYL